MRVVTSWAEILGSVMTVYRQTCARITQEEAAERASVTQATLSKWERGINTFPTVELAQLAQHYGSNLSDVLAATDGLADIIRAECGEVTWVPTRSTLRLDLLRSMATLWVHGAPS